MAVRDSITIRVSKKFKEEVLDDIKEKLIERGIVKPSYKDITDVLGLRIKKAGGLKED